MSDYKEYTVKVWDNGSKYWYLNDKLHREDGPAIEYASGHKEWYLNGKQTSKGCEGKVVVIEGIEYTLERKE